MKENISVISNSNFSNDINLDTSYYRRRISYVEPGFDLVNFRLTAEGGINIFHYLKSFNLLKKPGIVILSPNNHYYYEEDDFKSISTIIYLKKLNLIKDPDTFLSTLFRVLPPNVNFIGCFLDSKTLKGDRFFSLLLARFNNLLDSRTNHNMNKKKVLKLLGKYGFKVVDMTEMNGLIYFYSQNVRQPLEIRA